MTRPAPASLGRIHVPVVRVTVHHFQPWAGRDYQRGIYGPVIGDVWPDPDDSVAIWTAPEDPEHPIFKRAQVIITRVTEPPPPPDAFPFARLIMVAWMAKGPGDRRTGARTALWWGGYYHVTPGSDLRLGPLPLEVSFR